MNVYKERNQPKLLSRFNSVSQPQLSAIIGTETHQQPPQALEHQDPQQNGSRNNDWSYDATKKFLGQVKWTQQVSSLRSLISGGHKDAETEEDERLTDSGDSELSLDSDEFFQDNFPMLVRVIKGSYGIIKENESTLAKKYVNNLLLCGKTKSMFILCQSIKFKDKKPFIYGKNISIPITYNGWFEILSEDGKSVRPILSIRELANHAQSASNFKKMFNKPKNNISYIVRENITAYVIPTSSQVSMKIKSEDDEQMVSNLKLVDCKTSVIKAGDIVQIVGQVYIMHSSASSTFSAKVGLNKRIKVYKCQVRRKPSNDASKKDLQTDTLYLPEDAQGKYSPVARIENISGVHKLVDLVKKFRFPVTVQLVYGRAPPVTVRSSGSSSNGFSPILKLLKIYEEENVSAYPIGREKCLIQVPSRSKLSLVKAKNMRVLLKNSNYLRMILNECKLLIPEYSDMIYNLPESPPASVIAEANVHNTGVIQSCVKSLIGHTCLVDRSFVNLKENSQVSISAKRLQEQLLNLSLDCNETRSVSKQEAGAGAGAAAVTMEEQAMFTAEEENRTYQEIDDLYEYVRTGILPTYLDDQVQQTEASKQGLKKTDSSKSFTGAAALPPAVYFNQASNTVNRNQLEINLNNLRSTTNQQKYQFISEEPHKQQQQQQQQQQFHVHDNQYQLYYSKNPNRRVNFVSHHQNLPPNPVRHASYRPTQLLEQLKTSHHQLSNGTNSNNTKAGNVTTQEFIKKSSSYQQILAGGMSASCYVHSVQTNSRDLNARDQQSKSIHDELIDGGLFGKKTLSCERTAKAKQQADEEWLETIKKLSFECQANLKRENSATKQQLETNVPKFTQGELRNFVSMERLHGIYLNDDYTSQRLMQQVTNVSSKRRMNNSQTCGRSEDFL